MPGSSHELERDLGLVQVVAISVGAMIGSGIFILPGIAMLEAGPAVIVAFVIAGILVFPAAISIAELGTAMPEAGGDYIFIERGLGPGAGTIAGLGTWLMLMFKGALALVGGMFYLLEVAPQLPSVEAVAVTIGLVLIAVNLIGVKQTGGLQTIMVIVMLVIMGGFVAVTVGNVEGGQYDGFFDEGAVGLLGATALVLISYGGVTKVAAIAEEIENPGRNLPLGLLLSLGFTTALYALIVFVLVGVVEGEELEGSQVPMVDAVDPFFGFAGVVLIVLAAMLALISTANAGILTASRYPFALSRDRLLPRFFGFVHPRLHTPAIAILLTGGAMLVIIVTLPVKEIAETAGAFQIVVYILVNISLIAFREREPVWYDPEFEAPLYPWVQVFGVLSGIGIMTQMERLPIIGGVGIVILGFLWYLVYGRPRVGRSGIMGEVVTDRIEPNPEERERPYRIVVPVSNPATERGLLRIAAASAAEHEGAEVIVVNVVTVPDQTSLAQEIAFEKDRVARQQEILDEAADIAEELGVVLRPVAVVGRDISDAILDVLENEDADEIVLGWHGDRSRRDWILGSNVDPLVEHAPCEVTLVTGSNESVGRTVVFVGGGPHSELAVERGMQLVHSDRWATLELVNVQPTGEDPDATRKLGYELLERTASSAQLDPVEYEARVVLAEDVDSAILEEAETADTVVIGATGTGPVEGVLFGSLPERISEHAPGTVVIVEGSQRTMRSIRDAVANKFG